MPLLLFILTIFIVVSCSVSQPTNSIGQNNTPAACEGSGGTVTLTCENIIQIDCCAIKQGANDLSSCVSPQAYCTCPVGSCLNAAGTTCVVGGVCTDLTS